MSDEEGTSRPTRRSPDEKKPEADKARRTSHHHHSSSSASTSTPTQPGTTGRRSRSPHTPVITQQLLDPNHPEFQRAVASAEKLQKMMLAHEVALDKDFRVQNVLHSPTPGSLEAQLTEMMHQAFWDNLRQSLNQFPPDYSQALRLLDEVRQSLVTLLPNGESGAFGQKITQSLDMAHLQHQMDNDAFDFKEQATFVIDTMGKLCAPARDEQVAALKEIEDVVLLFKEVLRVLQDMKLDMLNYTLQQARPLIDQHAMEYEMQMFDEVASTQPDPLKNTRNWLLVTANQLLAAGQSDPNPIATWRISPMRLLQTAFRTLLTSAQHKEYPETLMSDVGRLVPLQQKVKVLLDTAVIYLVTRTSPVASALNLASLLESVKALVAATEEPDYTAIAEYLLSTITATGSTVKVEETDKQILRSSLEALKDPNHAVRLLLLKRLEEFVDSVLAGTPGNVPAGLSVVQTDLVQLVGQFAQIALRNQKVFGKHYTRLISEIADQLNLRNTLATPEKIKPEATSDQL